MRKWQSHSLFRFLSSLKLAVISILTLAAVLAVATVLESLYGMRGAHLLVYGQPWFYGVLCLLGTNVFCAALSRWPWKRHQIGFVTTHAGILILLAGSWLTFRFGVDGNLPVIEGLADSQVILHDLQLTLGDPEEGKSQTFPIPETALKSQGNLLDVLLPSGEKLAVETYLPRVRVSRVVKKSELGLGAPAVRVEIFNSRFSIDEWIIASDPNQPKEINLGPAILSLEKLWSTKDEQAFREGKTKPKPVVDSKGFIVVQFEGKEYRLAIEESLRHWSPVGPSGLEVFIERYLPYAIVENNQLVNRAGEAVNPTVQLRLRNPAGLEEKHTVFANFPDFSTLHAKLKKSSEPEFGARIRMIASQTAAAAPAVRGKLFFGQSADNGKLFYRITGKDSATIGEGEVETNKEVPTGWMDLRFRVVEWLPASISYEEPVYVEKQQGSENFSAAIELVRKNAQGMTSPADRSWVIEGSSLPVPVGAKTLEASFQRDRLTLPFQIFLKKFKLGTDPGTNKAASYESEVAVKDLSNPAAPEATISMNEPLQYGGYTFYQASYQMRDGQPPLSVFSVNRDPGRWVKYLGSLVMVLGILLMFYFNPHYWNIVLGSGRKRS